MKKVISIEKLPIILQLVQDFGKAMIPMKVIDAERTDPGHIRVTLEFFYPEKVLHQAPWKWV